MKTDLTLENVKVVKTPDSKKEIGVLVSGPLGCVSSAPEPRGFRILAVGRQKSAHSKVRVT